MMTNELHSDDEFRSYINEFGDYLHNIGSEVRRASPDGGLSDAMTSSAENYEHLDDVSTAWINQTAGASETTVDNYSNGMLQENNKEEELDFSSTRSAYTDESCTQHLVDDHPIESADRHENTDTLDTDQPPAADDVFYTDHTDRHSDINDHDELQSLNHDNYNASHDAVLEQHEIDNTLEETAEQELEPEEDETRYNEDKEDERLEDETLLQWTEQPAHQSDADVVQLQNEVEYHDNEHHQTDLIDYAADNSSTAGPSAAAAVSADDDACYNEQLAECEQYADQNATETDSTRCQDQINDVVDEEQTNFDENEKRRQVRFLAEQQELEELEQLERYEAERQRAYQQQIEEQQEREREQQQELQEHHRERDDDDADEGRPTERGRIKVLLAQWRQFEQQRTSRSSGSSTGSHARSRSCGPAPRRQQVMPTYENRCNDDTTTARSRRCNDDDEDDEPAVISRAAIRAKFETLDAEANKTSIVTRKKEFKWSVKEPITLGKPVGLRQAS